MFGELLESRAKRQRRVGGAAMSAAVHTAIIGAVAAGTMHQRSAAPEPVRAQVVHFAQIPDRPVEHARVQPRNAPPIIAPRGVFLHVVVAPDFIPKSLPTIDATAGLATDSIVVGGREGRGEGSGPVPRGTLLLTDDASAWDTHDIFTHVLVQGKPRYPEMLRSAGVDGRVLAQFVVDTTGRIDMSSVKILQSTHQAFSDAVRQALPNFRFRPSESGGRKIPVLAEMPFEFSISK